MEDDRLKGLYDGCTPQDRKNVIEYLEDLQSLTSGWKLCVFDFSHNVHSDDQARFFCLQVIEHHVRTRHTVSSDEDVVCIREFLFSWLYLPEDIRLQKRFIKKKMAQIFALVFVQDYPLKWHLFFSDLLSVIECRCSMPWTVEFYFLLLLAIDEEIVDRDIIHTQKENIRNTFIKDNIRDTCAAQLVKSWFDLMAIYESSDQELTCLAMSVVGAYISWMDIALIGNDTCIRALLKYLSVPSLRESAADCFHDILSKGMEPLSKVQMIESLFVVLEDAQILTLSEQEDEIEFLMRISKLVNRVGTGLINCYNQFLRAGDQERVLSCLCSIEAKVPYMLCFLTNEDDGVSENILNFAIQYITMLKQLGAPSDKTRQNVQALLYGVINKLKYDVTFNFSNQGEDEALFLEFRARLKVLYDNIAQYDSQLTLELVQLQASTVLSNTEKESFVNIELALLLLIYLGDNNFEKIFGSVGNPESPLYSLMSLVVSSQLFSHSHSAVVLQYYDVITKHYKYFSTCTHFIPLILPGFIDQRGLCSANPSIRSRVCYKFLQFLKSLQSHIGVLAVDVLQSVQAVISIPPCVPMNAGLITSNDQLFLFEACGYLIVYSSSAPEVKAELMRKLLSPLLDNYNLCLSQIHAAQTLVQQEEIGHTLYMLASYASRASKVFPNHQLALESGCLPCFEEALPIILKGLEVTVQKELLHSGVRQYLHRMVICLGDELLKYIPLAVSLLLKDCESHDIQEFIPLINQLLTKYKLKIALVVQEIFLPVIKTIEEFVKKPYDQDNTEEIRDRTGLQKAYYLFINSIALNNLMCVITNLGASHLHYVLMTLIEGTKHSEASIMRICFQTLKKFVESCGEDDLMPGSIDFAYKEILPVCFVVPIQLFDMDDAQAFLAIGEICGILKAMLKLRGDEFLSYLQSVFLPSIQVREDIIQELVIKLGELNAKNMKAYLKELFLMLRKEFKD